MFVDDLIVACNSIVSVELAPRDGREVPDIESVALKDGAVSIEASVLYADLADSTSLIDRCRIEYAAHVTRVFLYVTSRLIRRCDGEVRSFDGDRVMGVFSRENHATSANRAAFAIAAARNELIMPALQRKWRTDGPWICNYSVGLDLSNITVIRAGARGDNDLVWLGPAANHAAKLSGVRESPFTTFATDRFVRRTDFQRYSDGTQMWVPRRNDSYRSLANISLKNLG